MPPRQPDPPRTDVLVIGAGVLGLAIAKALAETGQEVVILEANSRIGEETSARSNEVIHAGFLYPAGSLKAELCLKGREMLYRYCESRGIPHRKVGKLMPAMSQEEIHLLDTLISQGTSAGVDDLDLLSPEKVRAIEPTLICHAALWSPSTGIIDTHQLMLALLADAEAAGALLVTNSHVEHVETSDIGYRIRARDLGHAESSIDCKTLINCAGLEAESLAHMVSSTTMRIPKIYFAKGTFYTLRGKAPFKHLIVPAGPALSQGASYTFDTAGQGRFGPDLDWVEKKDYRVDEDKADKFHQAILGYSSCILKEQLQPGYAGIRPRITGPRTPPGDWVIAGPETHGAPGLVHLLGMDTPGITACLSIAEKVKNRLMVKV